MPVRRQSLYQECRDEVDMFPQRITIKCIHKKSKIPIEGLLDYIRLFANHKNDYPMTVGKSDANSEIITRDSVEKEIEYYKNTYIMDFSSGTHGCKPFIKVKILHAEDLAMRC